jgi:hypothetical protein
VTGSALLSLKPLHDEYQIDNLQGFEGRGMSHSDRAFIDEWKPTNYNSNMQAYEHHVL